MTIIHIADFFNNCFSFIKTNNRKYNTDNYKNSKKYIHINPSYVFDIVYEIIENMVQWNEKSDDICAFVELIDMVE